MRNYTIFTKRGIKRQNFLQRVFVNRKIIYICTPNSRKARVAELVDALDSKSSFSNEVRVRFPPRVLYRLKRAKKKKPKNQVKQEFRLFYCSLLFPCFALFLLLTGTILLLIIDIVPFLLLTLKATTQHE